MSFNHSLSTAVEQEVDQASVMRALGHEKPQQDILRSDGSVLNHLSPDHSASGDTEQATIIQARFDLNRESFHLDVDLSLPASGVSAIFGPSGCGKTTLLRALAGLEKIPNGYLSVAGEIWQDTQRNLPTYKRSLGYVFQEASLFAHLSVKANLEYGLKRTPSAQRKIALEQAIELLGIGDLLERSPAQLSGGEQQRVAIARALAVSPRLLLLDEPMAALDDARKQEILPYFESLQRELTTPIIYVSHSRQEVARLADHVVMLEAGKVKAEGSVQDVFSRLDLAVPSDTETIINAVVAGRDAEFELNYLVFSGGRFAVAGKRLAQGKALRVQVQARDVSLTLTQQADTSILNIFAAQVEDLAQTQQAQMTVRLRIGKDVILARITRKSAAQLQLHKGQQVFAQIKSVAVLA